MGTRNIFRAKSWKSGEWGYGNFIHSEIFKGTGYENVIRDPKTGKITEIDINTLCQCVGIKDKKGIDIFEGDIFQDDWFDEEGNKSTYYYAVIYDYERGQYAFDASFNRDGSYLVNFVEFFGLENLEVVSNIYDYQERINK